MHQTKTAAPVLTHRNGQKTQGIAKSCILIVHKIPRLVQRLLIAAGAGGLGLAVGSAMPPMLGLTGWRPGLTLAGVALLAIGCAVEVMGE